MCRGWAAQTLIDHSEYLRVAVHAVAGAPPWRLNSIRPVPVGDRAQAINVDSRPPEVRAGENPAIEQDSAVELEPCRVDGMNKELFASFEETKRPVMSLGSMDG